MFSVFKVPGKHVLWSYFTKTTKHTVHKNDFFFLQLLSHTAFASFDCKILWIMTYVCRYQYNSYLRTMLYEILVVQIYAKVKYKEIIQKIADRRATCDV